MIHRAALSRKKGFALLSTELIFHSAPLAPYLPSFRCSFVFPHFSLFSESPLLSREMSLPVLSALSSASTVSALLRARLFFLHFPPFSFFFPLKFSVVLVFYAIFQEKLKFIKQKYKFGRFEIQVE